MSIYKKQEECHKVLRKKGIDPESKYLLARNYIHLIGKKAKLKNYNQPCNRYLNGKTGVIECLNNDLFFRFDAKEKDIYHLRKGVFLHSLKNVELLKEVNI